MNPAAAVVVRGVTKQFGALPALDGIDLEARAGSLLAIVGPNGAGKSTLLRLLAGLARPTLGEVRVRGVPAHRAEARAQVGLVAHATFLYTALTARENLVFAARLYDVQDPERRAETLLAEQGLEAVADRRTGSFSRGMTQRLAIARGLIHDPAIVLLDEPFSGLDRGAARRLSARLGALRRAQRALILVTHDVEQAAALADRALVLARGRVVHQAEGPELDAGCLEAAALQAGGEQP